MLHSLPVSDNGFFIRCHPLGEKASISCGKSFHYAPPPERNLFIASANICSKFLHHGPLVIWIILSTELANPLWNFYTPQIQWATLFHFCLFSAACRGLYAQNDIRISRWRHQMEKFSALLAFCVGNSPVSSEFPAQRPVTRSFDVFFDLHLNQQLSKQWKRWWFETLIAMSL